MGTEGYKKFPVMNAGVLTDANCGIDGINFGAVYGMSGSFNFQHTLFLFRSEDVSSFKLTCTVEVCLKSDKSSKCNRAASVCMDNDDDKKNYMCGVEVCDTNVCSIENNEPKCVVCTCANGVEATGAACLNDGDETCASCQGWRSWMPKLPTWMPKKNCQKNRSRENAFAEVLPRRPKFGVRSEKKQNSK